MKLALWRFSRSRVTALPVSVDADYGLPDFLDCVLFVSTVSLPADGKICSLFPSLSAFASGKCLGVPSNPDSNYTLRYGFQSTFGTSQPHSHPYDFLYD